MLNLLTRWLLVCVAALVLPLGSAHAQLYDVRTSTINIDKRERPALKVQVEGSAKEAREYWQQYLKESYNIRIKSGGVLGIGGNKEVMLAKQTPVSSISGKLLDLYTNVVAPSDSTAEVQVFAAFDNGTTWLDPDKTASEFSALRTMVQGYAKAYRPRYARMAIEQAEKQLQEAEKEKLRLEKEIKTLAADTVSNIARIKQLQEQNVQHATHIKENQQKLVQNATETERRKVILQRRRDRLSALDRSK
ncbi:hypothetical protein [Solirubrum puertoriconensis]|uniref:DUF4468 domain-containing protein n=1 Tax=Solirubrum puertoriconensis TaxID=1751427 RepID=A0A9X0HIL2_SOLP1|nr:hypothetical protein [Solirubrum puertoriconensis]KUG06550.1 hypothetical protein ASU33_04165 [Solirubrum puertoriconensis]